MARLRILFFVLSGLLGCTAAPAAVVHAGPYTYDMPQRTCFEVNPLVTFDGESPQLSSRTEHSTERSSVVPDASTAPSEVDVATEYGGGASLENLAATDATRIQNAANKVGVPITVVGSRAAGTSHAWSDWDYIVSGANSRIRGKIRNSLPEGPRGIGEPRKIDFIEGPVNTDFPYITFNPC
jgi:hypothetical protein